jgi:hypothetical protein
MNSDHRDYELMRALMTQRAYSQRTYNDVRDAVALYRAENAEQQAVTAADRKMLATVTRRQRRQA